MKKIENSKLTNLSGGDCETMGWVSIGVGVLFLGAVIGSGGALAGPLVATYGAITASHAYLCG